MPLLLFKILVICTSLLAWGVLCISGISLLHHNQYNKTNTIAIYIVLIIWVVSFYNSWYEGLFLFRKIALIPSLNSWSFTLLTPLFYFYFTSRITNRLPDARQWRQHLLFPGILAGIYIGMMLFNPISDKLIYSWSEFKLDRSAWWSFFRIGCYLLLVAQLLIYIGRFINNINDKYIPQMQLVKKELLFIKYFYIISIVSMLTSSYICNIIYNLLLIIVGGYVLKQSVFYRTIKRRIGFYMLPYFFIKAESKQIHKEKRGNLFSQEEAELLICLLNKPDILHNPNLTLKMLACELGTNATSLSQYFNQQLGVRFSDYVTICRLKEAEVLLRNTNIKVIEISELVGFQTSSTFYQAFNARNHMPPSQWRKKMKTDF